MQGVPPLNAALLSDISPFVYGTTRLGDETIPIESRIRVARAAMDSGVWFHTSHTYGNALAVLRKAFDQDRSRVPRLIVKLGWTSTDELLDVLRQNLEPLGLDHLELGQLCLGGALAEEFVSGGQCCETFSRLKRDGRVHRFVLEVFPWTSETALGALRSGHAAGIVDGYIFYLNPLQRFASNELWDLLVKENAPLIAMRTVCGAPVHRLRDVPGAAWKEYIQQRAAEVAPIFERSGVTGWTEFCVRFAYSIPQVRATVGSTSREENLREYLRSARDMRPLPEEVMSELLALHRRWSDAVDLHAEPWSM
jgi:aryl-alcohol dehydrogenase-like predicted oxidoreductase